jgi:Tol biopolymer transport system component
MDTHDVERELSIALRETLDRQQGPDPRWTGSAAARRVAEVQRRQRRWPLRVLAAAAVLGAVGAGALISGAPDGPAQPGNGWIAFTVERRDPAGDGRDNDIWFAALDRPAQRAIGTDTDDVDQVCPAFSPDGRNLAYGQVQGVSGIPDDGARLAGYRASALVIADVADDGTVADGLVIEIGDGVPPPCPVWSPDGDRVAFGVPRTSPINPTRSGEGSEVWVVWRSTGDIRVVPDLLAIDLDWSRDGSVLAIVGGVESTDHTLQDSRIHLYEPSTGALRVLNDTLGVTNVTWSPDGRHIAFAGRGPQPASAAAFDSGGGLRMIDVETGQQRVLADAYHATHGIGPVWSPGGETIAYQRVIDGSAEQHEVVLVTRDARSVVVMPREVTTADGSSLTLYPWRVTWSPDGSFLLYGAGDRFVSVPVAEGAPAVVLADMEGIVAYDVYPDAMRVPIQMWGRR